MNYDSLFHCAARLALALIFLSGSSFPAPAQAQIAGLPAPGSMLAQSQPYIPVSLKGLRVYPQQPLRFDFMIDPGQSGFAIGGGDFRAEAQKLVKYFLAALTVKESDLWVNLSPVERERMAEPDLARTRLGEDMLAQDYVLKQLTASLLYPEQALGQAFWQRVYARAREQFGSTDIPVDTFHKVWIVADRARVVERGNSVFVAQAHLKVMLESDYQAARGEKKAPSQEWTKSVVREVIVPEIEREVNQGRHFTALRQMFHAMILAAWYKEALKDALLNQVYSDRGKTGGVLARDPQSAQKIYEQYLQSFRQGVFDYIREESGPQGQSVPRKYFSGGVDGVQLSRVLERDRFFTEADRAQLASGKLALVSVMGRQVFAGDAAMAEDVLVGDLPEVMHFIADEIAAWGGQWNASAMVQLFPDGVERAERDFSIPFHQTGVNDIAAFFEEQGVAQGFYSIARRGAVFTMIRQPDVIDSAQILDVKADEYPWLDEFLSVIKDMQPVAGAFSQQAVKIREEDQVYFQTPPAASGKVYKILFRKDQEASLRQGVPGYIFSIAVDAERLFESSAVIANAMSINRGELRVFLSGQYAEAIGRYFRNRRHVLQMRQDRESRPTTEDIVSGVDQQPVVKKRWQTRLDDPLPADENRTGYIAKLRDTLKDGYVHVSDLQINERRDEARVVFLGIEYRVRLSSWDQREVSLDISRREGDNFVSLLTKRVSAREAAVIMAGYPSGAVNAREFKRINPGLNLDRLSGDLRIEKSVLYLNDGVTYRPAALSGRQWDGVWRRLLLYGDSARDPGKGAAENLFQSLLGLGLGVRLYSDYEDDVPKKKEAPGGISLDPYAMAMERERSADAVTMSFDPAMLAAFQREDFVGLEGEILRIVPVANPADLLGI